MKESNKVETRIEKKNQPNRSQWLYTIDRTQLLDLEDENYSSLCRYIERSKGNC